MILMLVLACSSYQFVGYIDKHHAVISAYSEGELNYELSLQRFTSDTRPSALLSDCKNV